MGFFFGNLEYEKIYFQKIFGWRTINQTHTSEFRNIQKPEVTINL